MIEDLRILFTVLSFLTFALIIWWAWRPSYKQAAKRAMSDVLADDDRVNGASNKTVEDRK